MHSGSMARLSCKKRAAGRSSSRSRAALRVRARMSCQLRMRAVSTNCSAYSYSPFFAHRQAR